jgi:hypothetical protein
MQQPPTPPPPLRNRASPSRRRRPTRTDGSGAYRFNNIPQNNYQLTADVLGFAITSQTVDVRSSLPITIDISLQLHTDPTKLSVSASAALVESEPSAHQDVDRSAFMKLPILNPANQLSQVITNSSGGVAADANGFFHPLGDHAQTSYMIDGQPISDQQNKVFSTQIPANALESMELITGSPTADYGDKSSLVVNATVRSGLAASKAFGNVDASWGSFGTWAGSASLGWGSPKFGNFIRILRSTRSIWIEMNCGPASPNRERGPPPPRDSIRRLQRRLHQKRVARVSFLFEFRRLTKGALTAPPFSPQGDINLMSPVIRQRADGVSFAVSRRRRRHERNRVSRL